MAPAWQILFVGNLAHACSSVGRNSEAVKTLERKLALCVSMRGAKHFAELVHRCSGLARVFATLADYARAIDAFTALGDRSEVALVEMDRGRAWARAGEYEKALALGEHALTLRVELGDETCLAAALDNLGVLYSYAADDEKALALMERSLAMTEHLGDHDGIWNALCNIAEVHRETQRDRQAIAYYGRALALAEATEDRARVAIALDELGELHRGLADDAQALAYSRRALAAYTADERTDDAERLRVRIAQIEGRRAYLKPV